MTAHDGRLVIASFAAAVSTIQYYHLDIMGSVRAVTDDAGATVERHDYKPFGEDTQTLPPPGTDPTRFVGAERDQTGLDYMGARYYSMFAGRFTSVDPVISGAAITDPQQWNRYAYARNNPLAFSDPTGTVIQPGYDCPTAACDSYNYGPDGPAIIDGGGELSSGYDDIVNALGGNPNRGNGETEPSQPPPTDTNNTSNNTGNTGGRGRGHCPPNTITTTPPDDPTNPENQPPTNPTFGQVFGPIGDTLSLVNGIVNASVDLWTLPFSIMELAVSLAAGGAEAGLGAAGTVADSSLYPPLDEIPGLEVDASGTARGAAQPDLTVNMGHEELKSALGKIGFEPGVAADGKPILVRGDTTITFYTRTSTKAMGAQVKTVQAGVLFKIRW